MILHLNADRITALKHKQPTTMFQKGKLLVNGKAIELSTSTKEANKSHPKKEITELLGMEKDEEEDKYYEKILKKVKAGDDLSPQELAYIRKKDPTLYQKLMLEIQMQKQLEEQLQSLILPMYQLHKSNQKYIKSV